MLNQITGLLDRGHSVSIFAERVSLDTEEHPEVEQRGLRCLTRHESLPDSPLDRLRRMPWNWREARTYLRALNAFRFGGTALSLRLIWSVGLVDGDSDFDIVQCHFGALGRKAALLRRVGALRGKIVTAFHGEDIVNYPRRFGGNVYAPLFATGDLFLPISDRWNTELVALGCPPHRIHVHRMGIELDRFPPRSTASLDTRLRIITVARLVEKKGIADGIRAVARLGSNVEYVVVGDGPLRAELEAVARTCGIADRVRFAGPLPRTRVVELLREATVFLAPSVTASDGDIEGLPVSIMEAMAVGLPIVTTRHGAIDELVEHGVSGWLVAERDVSGLAERLAHLVDDPGAGVRLGIAGRARIAQEFDAAKLVERLEALYGSLLA